MTGPRITFVLPFYNEAEFIGRTLASLAAQRDRGFALILVDNGSTDGGAAIAREACAAMPDIAVEFIDEPTPGKLNALTAGLSRATTPFVGTMDADTIYPPEYVGRILRLFGQAGDVVAVLAFGMPEGADFASARLRLYAGLLPGKCHTGGYGEAFRRDALEKAGGFDAAIWPYVIEDHEIVHRVGKLGRLAYDPEHVCFPSDRRKDRSDCSWSLGERVLYKLLPAGMMDWFFYRFLARRFERRGLRNIRLRDQAWRNDGAPS